MVKFPALLATYLFCYWATGLLQAYFPSKSCRLLPEDRAELKVYSIHEHRLAAHLDRFARLLPIVRNAILTEMGFKAQVIRISNLL